MRTFVRAISVLGLSAALVAGVTTPAQADRNRPAIDCDVRESAPSERSPQTRPGYVRGGIHIKCSPTAWTYAIAAKAILKQSPTQVFRRNSSTGRYYIDERYSRAVGPKKEVITTPNRDDAVILVDGLCSKDTFYYVKWEAVAVPDPKVADKVQVWQGHGVSNMMNIVCSDRRFTSNFGGFNGGLGGPGGGGWNDKDFERNFFRGWSDGNGGGGDWGRGA